MYPITSHRAPKPAASAAGFVLPELAGASKHGMVVIQKKFGLPINFVGVGEQADDVQAFDAKQFAEALFSEEE